MNVVIIAALPLSCGVRKLWEEHFVGLALVAVLTTFAPWDRKTLTSGTNVYFQARFVSPDSAIVFWHEDNTGGITSVVRDTDGFQTLLTNGKFQGNDSGEMIEQVSFALVPGALAGGRERALVIGLGTGQTAKVVADAGFRSVDVAEIAQGLIIATREVPTFEIRRLELPGLASGRSLLQSSGMDVASLAETQMLDEETLDLLLDYSRRGGPPINTDGNRHLEFSTPRYNLESRDRLKWNLRWLRDFVSTPERKARVVRVRKRFYQ